MERYRRQEEPSDYAYEAKPKKKIRGCVGPSVSEEWLMFMLWQTWACRTIWQAYPVSATQVS
jgi:hypothetical protein